MPQLPISLASSQPASANASQQSAAAAFGADAGDGLEGLQGLNFGAILGKQMKGVAKALLEAPENAKVDGPAEPDVNGEQAADVTTPAFLPVDFTALTAALPPVVIQQGSVVIQQKAEVVEEMPPAQVDASKPMPDLPLRGKAAEPAEIAGNGKNLPQGVSDEKLFADKLVCLVEPSSGKADSLSATDLPPSARIQEGMVAVAVVPRQVEPQPTVKVAPAVGSVAWGGALGEKVVWMVTQHQQVAELHLNPPSLGPLEVRLTVSNDQATALFVSHQPAVREAIETALPRLREMLADNGIMLGNATVSSESFSRQQAFDQGNGRPRSGVKGVDAMAGPLGGGGAALGLSREGMVDLFA